MFSRNENDTATLSLLFASLKRVEDVDSKNITDDLIEVVEEVVEDGDIGGYGVSTYVSDIFSITQANLGKHEKQL